MTRRLTTALLAFAALPLAASVPSMSLAQNKIAAIPADLFKEYQEGQSFYKDNPELYNLIGDFNTITQYAFFDLLKKQLPEEASRLGIQ